MQKSMPNGFNVSNDNKTNSNNDNTAVDYKSYGIGMAHKSGFLAGWLAYFTRAAFVFESNRSRRRRRRRRHS